MKILFFDGYCSLCNTLVDWAISQDRHNRIQFASLQGETAKSVLPDFNLQDSDTVVYWREGQTYQRSVAILYLLKDIGWPWNSLQIFFIVPVFVRDQIYRWVARNRYRFFKSRETCRMPNAAEKAKLLP